MVDLDEGGRAAGTVHLQPPIAALRPWVEYVSVQREPRACRRWRVVPDSSGHVIVSATPTQVRCRVVGARSTYADIDVTQRTMTIAVRFRPGALAAFLRDSAATLTDRGADVADVLGQPGRDLLDRLYDSTADEAAALLSEAVRVRLSNANMPALGLQGVRQVRALGSRLGLSPRAVHTRIRDSVGLAPKRMLRIERLLRALRLAPTGTLAATATSAGYSDQAHFAREARELLGQTPRAWLARGADSFKIPR